MGDQPTEDDAERVLADCVEDFLRRKALGERPRPDDYAGRVGSGLAALKGVIEMEELLIAAFDDGPTRASALPRPFGEYTILRELGRGAMGVVYEAVHLPLGRTVALKVLRTGIDTDSVALERFRREARACAQVRHCNIVEVYDAGQVDGQPYYSMALLHGRTLHHHSVAHSLPPLADLLRGFAAVADALAALHAVGIVHRDVKPSNILLAADRSMVLADFGLARTAQSERVTATGQALGTPLYMSPEQILGRAADIDGRSDVYGLGATMYEVFTGRQLFHFDDVASAMRLILKQRPESPRALRPDLPPDLERIILKCLEKSKDDRYATATALRDDLLNLAQGRKVVGRPVSEVERGLRRARRFSPAIAAGVVAAAVGGWWWTHREATLTVSCWPLARVTIDDVPRGDTTVVARLAPGRHVLTLAQAGFSPHSEPMDLEPGARLDLRQVLIAQAGDDPDALARIGRQLEVAMPSLKPLTSDRGESDDVVRLLWPCGDVRIEDLSTWRIEVPEKLGAGKLEFRRADKVVVEEAFAPTNLVTERPIPDAVRAGLQSGDRVTWGFVPDVGKPVIGEFTVTGKDLRARFEEIAERTKEQPKGVAAHLRAQFLLDAGLCLAAYREANALTVVHRDDRRAWLVMQHALDRLQLRDTKPWREASDGLASAPETDPTRGADRGGAGLQK